MKRVSLSILASVLMFVGCANSKTADMVYKSTKSHMHMFQSVPLKDATILQSGKNRFSCSNCSMNLPAFYKIGSRGFSSHSLFLINAIYLEIAN